MSLDLSPYQKALSSGGIGAVQKLSGFFADLAQVVPEEAGEAGHHFEALAFDALTHGHAGWCCVCMGAATEQFQRAELAEDLERCVQQHLAVLEEGFPPFQNQSELLDAMRTWARLRVAALTAGGNETATQAEVPGSPFHAAVLARHRWWFSLLRTRQLGHKLECDALLDGLGANLAERILLWTATVICDQGRGGVRAGVLVKMLSEDDRERNINLGLLDLGGRLRQSGLILMIPEGHHPGPIENWWLKPHPEVHDFLLSGRPLSETWKGMFLPQKDDAEGVLALWRAAFYQVGLMPPREIEAEAAILSEDARIVQKVCEQLSIDVWMRGEPGQPIPMGQLRSALETHRRE
jgi:hypothetical protein